MLRESAKAIQIKKVQRGDDRPQQNEKGGGYTDQEATEGEGRIGDHRRKRAEAIHIKKVQKSGEDPRQYSVKRRRASFWNAPGRCNCCSLASRCSCSAPGRCNCGFLAPATLLQRSRTLQLETSNTPVGQIPGETQVNVIGPPHTLVGT